jgi:hypothetical protein
MTIPFQTIDWSNIEKTEHKGETTIKQILLSTVQKNFGWNTKIILQFLRHF